MRKTSILFFLLASSLCSIAQLLEPVKWTFESKKIEEGVHELYFTAKIDEHWHVYSQHIDLSKEVHPVPTSFHFEPSEKYKLTGEFVKDESNFLIGFINESQGHEVYDPVFEMDLKYFTNQVVFTQRIEINSNEPVEIKGYLEYMCCDTIQCLPPAEVDFSIRLNDKNTENSIQINDAKGGNSSDTIIKEEQSLWLIFIEGFLGGLLALVTPCVFPMIPMTVSYFLKQSGGKAKGIKNATMYGLSIIVIFVVLGLTVSYAFGPDAMNAMASDPWFNIFFFLLLVFFGAAFLGAFELTLPSSWVNKVDSMSEKAGGILGIFLMAFTLALVSFSCTAPIVGTLLVDFVVTKNVAAPIVGMTGFALALGIPFSFFAIFPSWLNTLPKSGGWLNSVKVVLGFLELALSLKFLSNADLVMHWGLLDREVYLVLWVAIFTLLGFYFLGKLKFAHDTELEYISVTRLLFSICSFGFAIYLVPGLWGAPLNAISAFPPPLATQDFVIKQNILPSGIHSTESSLPKKNANLFHCPHDLNCFFDYDEALNYAKEVNKPLFVDFTGWSCVNCRNMEASVWSDPEVLKRFNENFVMVSLYVDDKTPLPEEEKYISDLTQKKVKNIGNKWSDLEASKFGKNSQPYYVILNHEGKLLADAAFDLKVENYIQFLDKGLELFNNKNQTP